MVWDQERIYLVTLSIFRLNQKKKTKKKNIINNNKNDDKNMEGKEKSGNGAETKMDKGVIDYDRYKPDCHLAVSNC